MDKYLPATVQVEHSTNRPLSVSDPSLLSVCVQSSCGKLVVLNQVDNPIENIDPCLPTSLWVPSVIVARHIDNLRAPESAKKLATIDSENCKCDSERRQSSSFSSPEK